MDLRGKTKEKKRKKRKKKEKKEKNRRRRSWEEKRLKVKVHMKGIMYAGMYRRISVVITRQLALGLMVTCACPRGKREVFDKSIRKMATASCCAFWHCFLLTAEKKTNVAGHQADVSKELRELPELFVAECCVWRGFHHDDD
jgi:hypothetical protein